MFSVVARHCNVATSSVLRWLLRYSGTVVAREFWVVVVVTVFLL